MFVFTTAGLKTKESDDIILQYSDAAIITLYIWQCHYELGKQQHDWLQSYVHVVIIDMYINVYFILQFI